MTRVNEPLQLAGQARAQRQVEAEAWAAYEALAAINLLVQDGWSVTIASSPRCVTAWGLKGVIDRCDIKFEGESAATVAVGLAKACGVMR